LGAEDRLDLPVADEDGPVDHGALVVHGDDLAADEDASLRGPLSGRRASGGKNAKRGGEHRRARATETAHRTLPSPGGDGCKGAAKPKSLRGNAVVSPDGDDSGFGRWEPVRACSRPSARRRR